jgi:LmbE family N-acetylglucosaminyl deacetylase
MKVLAIGAHFDDVELGCGGTLLKHKACGDEIYIIVATDSGYKDHGRKFDRKAAVARREGEASARRLGATLTCLDKKPIVLVPTEEFVLQIERLVNEIKPDRVYTHQPDDSHADHAAVGFVSMRACRKCNEVLLYRSNWYIMDNAQDDNVYVNISDHINEKMEYLKIFKSEMRKVNYSWLDFVKKQNSAAGAKVDVAYAETFHLVKSFWK